MTYPTTQSMQDTRVQERNDVGLPLEDLDDPQGPGGLCRPGEILADDAGLRALERVVGADQFSVTTPVDGSWRVSGNPRGRQLRELNARLRSATGLQVATVISGMSVAELVDAVRSDIADNGGEGRAYPNRVLTGEPVYMGGPGELPEKAGAVALESHVDAAPRQGGAIADIAVLDTGIPHAGRPQWLLDVTDPDPTDWDDLRRPDNDLATQAGHGLFICGIVTRVAGGTLLIDPGRVLDQYGYAGDDEVSLELHEATAPVLNLSWGCFGDRFGPPAALAIIIDELVSSGRVIVAAAGNHDSDLEFYPAAFKGVIAVGALDTKVDPPVRAEFSNFGDSWVDVWAPGRHLHSAYVTGRYPVYGDHSIAFEGGYAYWSGTSFAAPVVAAEIARQYKQLQPADARQVADDFISGLPVDMVPGAGPDPVKVYIPLDDLTV